MGEYVSPFSSGTTSGSKKKKERYISPFEGSIYNDDYWDQQDKQRAVATKQKVADETARKQREDEEKRKKEQEAKDNDWLNKANEVAKGIGGFVFGGSAKLANQGLAIGEKVAVNIAGETQKLFGDKEGGEKTINEGVKSIDERLLKEGAGLFGAGGIYQSSEALHNADIGEVARKTAGTTLQSASEVLPIGAGIRVAKGAGKVGSKILDGALEGAASAGLGSIGSQIVEGEGLKGDEILKSVGTGAVLGGATGGLLGKFVNKKRADELDFNEQELATQQDTPSEITKTKEPTDLTQQVETAPKRSESYEPSLEKTRVSKEDAVEKLRKSGYTDDESLKVLEDALPDKGLSMPGSPKKIGYDENSIKQAAEEYDNSLVRSDISPEDSQYISEQVATHNTPEEFVDELVDRIWAQNKKGAGTNIVRKDADAQGIGSDVDKGIRISENNPFYRDYFAENGTKPTKQAIRDMVEQRLGTRNAKGEYKDILTENEISPHDASIYSQLAERQGALSSKTNPIEGDTTPDGTNLTPLGTADGKSEIGISKLGQSVKDNALHEKLISKAEAQSSDLPTFNKANMKQQAEYATGLIKTNPKLAVDIAMGRKSPPEHILPQMVYNAVEDHAIKIGGDKGAQLLKDLAGSRQVSNLTVMAQNIRAAAERDPHSPVTMMNEVKLARAEAAKKRGKDLSEAEKKDVKMIKKATPEVTKDDWDSFVEGLVC